MSGGLWRRWLLENMTVREWDLFLRGEITIQKLCDRHLLPKQYPSELIGGGPKVDYEPNYELGERAQ
jgi:hypothetical protein